MNPLLIRRRGMMQAQGGGELSDYVQSGLVHHLDGIEKGSTANKWTDLVGNIVYETYQGSPIFNSDNVEFNGNSRMAAVYTAPMYNAGTIEAVFDKTVPDIFGVIFASATTAQRLGMAIGSAGNLIWVSNGNHPSYAANLRSSTSVSADGCWVNGAQQMSDGTASFSHNANAYSSIGGRYYNSASGFFTGRIYSIRIYNRRLSVAEILQNLSVDRKRFGIG